MTYRKYRPMWVILLSFSLTSCFTVTKLVKNPAPSKYGSIDDVMFDNGYPKKRQTWVVYSDRDKNRIGPTRFEDLLAYKKVRLSDPFIVLKRKKGMLKIAEYKPELLNGGKLVKRKNLKIVGWAPQEQLLLWNSCLKDSETGYAVKAALVVNNTDVILHSEEYMDLDSVFVFDTPDLVNKTPVKVNIGRFVYVYKQSEDRERFLIGDKPDFTPDSAKNSIYGWVSRNVLSFWGERTGIKLNRTDSENAAIVQVYDADSSKAETVTASNALGSRTGIETIFPVRLSNEDSSSCNHTKFFTNAFDYEANRIYNVLGNYIYYNRYKEILADNRKLNIIFVLDVSQNNNQYLPLIKSGLQDIRMSFINPSYFNSIKFGGVVYKQNACGVKPLYSSLTGNYRDVTQFFDDRLKDMQCSDADVVQPVDQALLSAANMLNGAEDETNIVIVIGTTAAGQPDVSGVVDALTKVRAKLIFFQTQAEASDAYNNFVLFAAKTVVNSAQNIAEIKKEKIVDQANLLAENSYSLAEGENGIYRLDYPKGSMTQGYVIFPKKGETMQVRLLKTTIDSLIGQLTFDNKKTDSTLTTYFRSVLGVNNTTLYGKYESLYPQLSGEPVPPEIASGLMGQENTFLIDGKISNRQNPLHVGEETGILLNEEEYDRLQDYYKTVYKKVLGGKEFNRRPALRRYVRILLRKKPMNGKLRRRELYRQTMNYTIGLMTGFHADEAGWMNSTLKKWKRDESIPDEAIAEYFKQYARLANKLSVSKGNSVIRINYGGQVFFWLNDEFIPTLRQ